MPNTAASNTASRRFRTIAISAAVLLALAGGAGILAAAAKPPAAPTKAQTSDVTNVRKQAFDITTTANGDLQAKNQIELRSTLERDATIQSIIPEGTRVKKGDMVVKLNGDSIQTQIDEQTPRLASARAAVVAAENQYQIQLNDNASALRKAELQLELAQLALKQWEDGDVVKRRQELSLEISRSELDLERLAEKLRRSEDLLREGFIAKDERDRDEVAYIEAISKYKNAALAAEVYENFEFTKERKQKLSDVEEARAEVDRVKLNNDSQLASKDADRLSQREQLTLLETQVRKYNDQLAATTIVAPQDGLVVYATSLEGGGRWGNEQGAWQIGQQVYPNQLIVVLPDTSEMIAAVRVHEAIAGRVRPGQLVNLKIDAAGGRTFEGVVDSIGVMAETGGWRDPNLREYTVRVALKDQDDAELKPSMRVEARILLSKVDETLTVPVQSLFSEGAVQFVYLPEGNKFIKRPVRIGRRSETLAEVAAGLQEGQAVLLRTPQPGEVLARSWNDEELKVAGYKTLENGQIVADRPAGAPGGRPSRGPGTGGAPAQPAADGAAARPRADNTPR
ncbi:MAG TPA: HlyD family efflux transporter periplasmic adaptor subunit [Phycisphaerales bacterium]|nr:HlyD family efflux transporter periplasmic adaptor subunit [Phycisphaerales bacterium]